MRKYNKFLTLLLCISLSFLVSCMNEGKSDTDTTEKQPDGILTDAVNTEAIATSAPVTTALQEAEICVDHTDQFYYDLMYETDEQGNWIGFGIYIINYEFLADIDSLLLSRSQEAYDEIKSISSGQETEKTLYTVFNDFEEDVKLILEIKNIEYTEERLGMDPFKFLMLKSSVTDATIPVVTTALPLPQTRTEPVTSAPVTSAPVTTTAPKTEPSEPSDEYFDDILMDIMYETDDDGKWSGFGKYITNFDILGIDVLSSLEMRSESAYNEVASLLSLEESEKTVADIYNEFKSDVKLILRVKGIEFTIHDVLGYEILKLQ